jgi:hypothetical protein
MSEPVYVPVRDLPMRVDVPDGVVSTQDAPGYEVVPADFVAEARALAAAATPGPWRWTQRGIDGGENFWTDVIVPGRVECMAYCYGGSSTFEMDNEQDDAEFIAAARSLVPALCDQVDRARNVAVQLEQQIAAVLAIHVPVVTGAGLGDVLLYSCDVCLSDSGEEPDWGHDPHDMVPWPCATARALGVQE